MKKRSLSKKIVQFFGGVVMAAFVAAISMPAYAMEDGAYTVGRSTSYANPQTGETVDGGTNIALGDSMCASIVEGSALVEQYQGNTYVTLGIGLMSNISSVRFQIQGADGSYREVSATQTGSCQRDGDTCNHYRIQVDSADLYISPILYVVPMGRDVQFFVKLDIGSATPGTGNFVSQMIPAAPAAAATEPAASAGTTSSVSSTKAAGTTAAENTNTSTADAKTKETDAASKHENEEKEAEKEAETATESLVEGTESLMAETELSEADTENSVMNDTEDATETTEIKKTESKKKSHAPAIVGGIVVLLVAGGGAGYCFYRKKRN